MRWANGIMLGVNAVLALLLFAFLGTRGLAHIDQPFSLAELLIIVLTAVIAILTTLAIFLAVLGVLGFSWVRNEIHRAVRDRLASKEGARSEQPIESALAAEVGEPEDADERDAG
jgi:hypothetical protein